MAKKTKKKYTLVKGEKDMIHLDDLETAREGLEYFGRQTYIRYNDSGLKEYNESHATHNEVSQ